MLKNILDKILKTLFVLTDYNKSVIDIKGFFLRKCYENVITHKIKKNTVLVTDPLTAHGELMPGIIKYCLNIGYNVEVLITDNKNAENPLFMFKGLKVFSLPQYFYNKFLQSDKIKQYEYVIFTSSRIYCKNSKNGTLFLTDYLPNIQINKEKMVFVEHRLDLPTKDDLEKYKFMALPLFSEKLGYKMINPHYFGKIKNKSKNKITNFISVGSIENKRRNAHLLIKAVKTLHKKGIKNFKITIVGKGDLSFIPKEIQKYFTTTGRVKYTKMYKTMEKSDFFLPLLVPENPEHDRYISDGTSGSFQLVYGFLKPCLIQEKFSEIHGFNTQNSFVYKSNSDLAKTMESAINQSNEDYKEMQKKIAEYADSLYEQSLKNLSEILKTTLD